MCSWPGWALLLVEGGGTHANSLDIFYTECDSSHHSLDTPTEILALHECTEKTKFKWMDNYIHWHQNTWIYIKYNTLLRVWFPLVAFSTYIEIKKQSKPLYLQTLTYPTLSQATRPSQIHTVTHKLHRYAHSHQPYNSRPCCVHLQCLPWAPLIIFLFWQQSVWWTLSLSQKSGHY